MEQLKYIRTIFCTALICSTALFAYSQDYIEDQIPKPKKYNSKEVIDQIYGITMYEALNKRMGGDSIRYCDGYSCSGWVEDFYLSDEMIHRGYYVDGKLTIYKNYYPGGNIERDFRIIDDYKAVNKLYYPDGTLKSEVRYQGQSPYKWSDYHPNGQLEYYEEYDKNFEYYKEQSSYYSDGKPQDQLLLDNKKRLIFTKQEFFPNGQVKESGEIRYNTDLFDYQKIGKWSIYNENGKLLKEQFYENGKLNKEKEY